MRGPLPEEVLSPEFVLFKFATSAIHNIRGRQLLGVLRGLRVDVTLLIRLFRWGLLDVLPIVFSSSFSIGTSSCLRGVHVHLPSLQHWSPGRAILFSGRFPSLQGLLTRGSTELTLSPHLQDLGDGHILGVYMIRGYGHFRPGRQLLLLRCPLGVFVRALVLTHPRGPSLIYLHSILIMSLNTGRHAGPCSSFFRLFTSPSPPQTLLRGATTSSRGGAEACPANLTVSATWESLENSAPGRTHHGNFDVSPWG